MSESKKSGLQPVWRFAVLLLVAAFFIIALPVSICNSLSESKSDDSVMTESLIDSYMKSVCDYDIAGMNKCSMARLESYNDCEEAVKACAYITSRIEWECENISIDGNSAIAQIRMTVPGDFDKICHLALSDLMKSIDSSSDDDPADLLASYVRKRAGKAETTALSAEISMTKVNNRWYIVKSLGVNRLLSDIRTQVACAFSVIGR